MKQNRLGVCSSGDCRLKNPICLVALRADRFEKTVDHEVVFQRHAQFAGGEVGSELTIDKDCPATAPANADEPSVDC